MDQPILGSSVCLICFEMIEKHIFVPSDAPEKLFINCNKYLHSTLTKGTLKDIELHNENQVPLCMRCFDSALELTQLSEQLAAVQKDISDLTVTFSMAVFHRRSLVYGMGQSCKTSPIVEFNEACLPPNLFSMKLGDKNIQPNKNNQEMDISGLHLQTDISNVKCEAKDIQFDNLSGNPQQSVANDDAEIQFHKENLDKQCGHPTIEQIQNLVSVSEMRIVHVTGGNISKKCADPNDGVTLTMSDILKSVKMPNLILERIKIVGHKFNVSVVKPNQTKCEYHQKNLDETFFKDEEVSVPSCATKSPENGKLLKCFYCEKTFTQECHRTLHHKIHTEGKNKRPLGKQKFVYRNNQKICKMIPTGKKKFKCSYCEKEFYISKSLVIHEMIHTGEKPFKCSFCNDRFNDRSNLKRHESTHTGEKPFKCSFCNNRFIQRTHLTRHERTHTGEKPFKCSFCTTRFNESGHLKRHERIHTGEKPFKCSFCNNRFSERSNLKSHERTHTGEKPFKCSFCNNRFSERAHLNRHERTHTGEKPFKCSFCNNRFNSSGNLKRHEITHTGEKPFKCSFCNNRFNSSSSLKIHERTHTGEKPFKCSFCDNRFNSSTHMKSHERTHTGEKPFKCPFCNKRFSERANLKSHERTHTGEKPFKCSFCTTRFNESGHLKRHEKIHTGEKPFKCSFCSNRFNQRNNLKSHERTHTGEKPFKCSFCDNRFSSSTHMKSHERTHTGEKPFKCSFCNNRFNDRTNLKSHERTHTGEKPFKCSFCDNRFNRRFDLKRHERTHSMEKPFKSSHQRDDQEQVSTLNTQVDNQKDLKHQEKMDSTDSVELNCSFCEMTFSHDEERANHEKIHIRDDEIVNENL